MLPSERPSILLLCNPHSNDVSVPCINSSRCFYQVDQLFDIPRGLDLRGRHGGSSCAWCSADISQAREGRWALGFGDERETDVCRAGGCSGTLPTCANNLSAVLCYSSRTVPENGQSRLVLLPGGGHRSGAVWRANRAASLCASSSAFCCISVPLMVSRGCGVLHRPGIVSSPLKARSAQGDRQPP